MKTRNRTRNRAGDPLWTARDASRATRGRANCWVAATGVSIDTRELEEGDLFVALQGEHRDGHHFVAEALERGAAAAMVTHFPDGISVDAPLLLVDDTLEALRGLARHARARSQARVVAVTGSVGKTTTKDMLAAMLSAQGRTHSAARSFNNHWGVPLTLARMPADTQFAVLEIGMNHAGEIAPLSELARPHVAVVTGVEPVHLEYFDSVEAIADAKAEIFAGLVEGATAVLNRDNPHFERLEAVAAAAGATVTSFGESGEIALRAAEMAETGTVVEAAIGAQPVMFRLNGTGRHFAMNACAALAAVLALGADPARAVQALGDWCPREGRGARETILLGPAGLDGAITLIDESFNANPASVRAALAVLGAAPVVRDTGGAARGQRIAFLGDMLELGAREGELHAALADLPEAGGIDIFHCCGPRMQAFHAALPRARRGRWFASSAELAAEAPRLVDAGDVCMVKGSKGAAMGPVVTAIRTLGRPARPQPAVAGAGEA